MRRREFMAGLGSAAARLLVARAKQPERPTPSVRAPNLVARADEVIE
jgi:hypothetical protein